MLCVNIRRVAVDQCVWPVIGTDQWCKVPMLDLDLAQALLHLREVVDTAIKHDLAGLIRLLIASIALSDNIIIPRGPLDVRKPPGVELTPEVEETLTGVGQPGELALQLPTVILDTAIQIDEIAVDIVIYLQLTGPLRLTKQHPTGPAKHLDIPTNQISRKARYNLLAQCPLTADPTDKTVNSNLSSRWYCKGASSDKLRMSGDIQPPDIAS